MKIYVHYEDNDTKPVTLKISLPKKWESQPLLQVLEVFEYRHLLFDLIIYPFS